MRILSVPLLELALLPGGIGRILVLFGKQFGNLVKQLGHQ